MKNIIILVVAGLAIWYWQKGGFSSSGGSAVDENGNAVVLVFTFDDCGKPCTEGVNELNKRGVPYQELVISQDEPDSENFKRWQALGQGGFPFTVAGEEKVIGSSKAQLATLLAKNFGEKYLTAKEKRYFSKHFAADGTPKIVLYGTSWCPFCVKLREDMNAEGVGFVDIDVEKNGDSAKMDVLTTMEIQGYPATWFGYQRMRSTTWNKIKAEM